MSRGTMCYLSLAILLPCLDIVLSDQAHVIKQLRPGVKKHMRETREPLEKVKHLLLLNIYRSLIKPHKDTSVKVKNKTNKASNISADKPRNQSSTKSNGRIFGFSNRKNPKPFNQSFSEIYNSIIPFNQSFGEIFDSISDTGSNSASNDVNLLVNFRNQSISTHENSTAEPANKSFLDGNISMDKAGNHSITTNLNIPFKPNNKSVTVNVNFAITRGNKEILLGGSKSVDMVDKTVSQATHTHKKSTSKYPKIKQIKKFVKHKNSKKSNSSHRAVPSSSVEWQEWIPLHLDKLQPCTWSPIADPKPCKRSMDYYHPESMDYYHPILNQPWHPFKIQGYARSHPALTQTSVYDAATIPYWRKNVQLGTQPIPVYRRSNQPRPSWSIQPMFKTGPRVLRRTPFWPVTSTWPQPNQIEAFERSHAAKPAWQRVKQNGIATVKSTGPNYGGLMSSATRFIKNLDSSEKENVVHKHLDISSISKGLAGFENELKINGLNNRDILSPSGESLSPNDDTSSASFAFSPSSRRFKEEEILKKGVNEDTLANGSPKHQIWNRNKEFEPKAMSHEHSEITDNHLVSHGWAIPYHIRGNDPHHFPDMGLNFDSERYFTPHVEDNDMEIKGVENDHGDEQIMSDEHEQSEGNNQDHEHENHHGDEGDYGEYERNGEEEGHGEEEGQDEARDGGHHQHGEEHIHRFHDHEVDGMGLRFSWMPNVHNYYKDEHMMEHQSDPTMGESLYDNHQDDDHESEEESED